MKRASWPPGWALAAAALWAAGISGCKSTAEPGKPSPSAAPSAATAPPETLRLDRRPAQIGETRHAERKSSLTLGVEFWQDGEKLGTNDSVRSEEYKRTVQVQGLVGGAPAKASVHYDHYRLHETAPDKPTVDDSELEGKSYLLDATDGKLQIRAGDGKAVSRTESEKLRRLDGDLGKDDPIVALIGDTTLVVGKPLPMREELLRDLITAQSGELKVGRIWLDEIRTEPERKIAVFKWSADTHSREDNGLEITWHLTGRVLVSVSPAMTVETSLTGSLDVTGETMQHGAKATLAGAGSIKDLTTLAVSRP